MITNVLMIGCGDVAIRVAEQLPEQLPSNVQCFGVRRNVAALPSNITGIACDLNGDDLTSAQLPDSLDYVIITLVPSERSAAGYQQSYVDNLGKIIAALRSLSEPPKKILFVSSTSVYGQSSGEQVDEESVTHPASYAGENVLAGEQLISSSGLNTTVVRFSGIYGPGRERLISQVKNGDRSGPGFSNRIHADDAAGVLAFLIAQIEQSRDIAPVYLATDCEPVLLSGVKMWLAEKMELPPLNSSLETEKMVKAGESQWDYKRGNKRCSNARLVSAGYRFRYPTFREGYRNVLSGVKN